MTLCAEKLSHLIRYERVLFRVFAYITYAFLDLVKKYCMEDVRKRQIPVVFSCTGTRTVPPHRELIKWGVARLRVYVPRAVILIILYAARLRAYTLRAALLGGTPKQHSTLWECHPMLAVMIIILYVARLCAYALRTVILIISYVAQGA